MARRSTNRGETRIPPTERVAMKGLIFNLLDTMARQSGCADQAWDLVMEFVANETDCPESSDTCLSSFDAPPESLLAFETPAEAMIQCLGTESSGLGESLSEFPDMAPLFEAEEWADDNLLALVEPDFTPPPNAVVNEGFSQDLLGLLEQLLAEALSTDEDEEDFDEYDDQGFLSFGTQRRSGS